MVYFHVRREKKIKSFIEQKVFTSCLLNNKMEENQKGVLHMEVQDHLETAEGRGQSVWRSMSLFLVPLLLSNVLQSVGQLVGMVFVGRWLELMRLPPYRLFPLFFC